MGKYRDNFEGNFKVFDLALPNNWEKFDLDGIDSYVGGITNETDTLYFDYGWYSDSFEDQNRETQLFETITINGKIALITKPKIAGNGTIGVHIKKAFKKDRFSMFGENIKNEEQVIDIFKSLKFRNSDTTKNSKSIQFRKSD
jgi:hypothetical protein